MAQNADQANKLFQDKDYVAAQDAYSKLLRKAPKNALYLYRYARCAQEQGQDSVAIAYFLQAGERYDLRNYYLAELYTKHYYFEQALPFYQKYLQTIKDDEKQLSEYIRNQIAYVQKGARYLRRVTDVTIVDSVTVPKATFLQAYHLSAEAGHLEYDKEGITYTNQRNDRKIETDTVGNVLRLLSCQRLLDGWSACDTLRIEVEGNLNYPYVLSDGLTLYFASTDPAGLGGYDIYFTRYNAEQNTYLTPENIGFPFNSSANDYMLVLDEAQNIGWFATDRFTPDSLVGIYTFIPNAETKILRNVDSTYLREAAQLKRWTIPHPSYEIEKIDTKASSNSQEKQESHFVFVINNEVVYYSLIDFKSEEARKLMETYLTQTAELTKAENELQNVRKQYATANEEERTSLAATILSHEEQLPAVRKEVERLEKEIRRVEMSAITQ